MFCNSPAVILGESLFTQTLLLTVPLDDIDTRPLLGSFITFSVDWKFLIFALMVELFQVVTNRYEPLISIVFFSIPWKSMASSNCLITNILRNIFFFHQKIKLL